MNFNSQNFWIYSFPLLAGGGFHLADAVSCVYAGPENGVMAANPLDIKEDIPVKETCVKCLKKDIKVWNYKSSKLMLQKGVLRTNLRNA